MLSWFTTAWSGLSSLKLLPGWQLVANMLASWTVGAAATVFYLVIGHKVACWLEMWVCWLVSETVGQMVPRILPVLQAIPSVGAFTGNWWYQGWQLFMYVFPVETALVTVAGTMSFITVFRWGRFGKMFIPTASN